MILTNDSHSSQEKSQIPDKNQNNVNNVIDNDDYSTEVCESNDEFYNELIQSIDQQIHSDFSADMTLKNFTLFVKEAIASMTIRLYAKVDMNYKCVGDTILEMIKLYNVIFVGLIKQKFKHSNQLSLMIMSVHKTFKEFDSRSKVFNYFTDIGCLILPNSWSVNRGLKSKNKKGAQNIIVSPDNIQTIEIKKILKKFLELPNVFESIITNIHDKETSKNFDSPFSGQLYQSIKRECENRLVLPLSLYNDDFTVNNVLGACRVIHKIGGVYFSIFGIPDEYASQLENIFLFQLHDANHHKEFGNKKIFAEVIDQLKDLIINGIDVNYNSSTTKVHFFLFQVISDNLGANTILGFVRSFNGTHCCRVCLASKEEILTMTKENVTIFRDKNNYDQDCLQQSSGIREECIFNQLPYFHVLDNTCFDPCHDLLEGICRYDMGEILHDLIYEKNCFTLSQLNWKIKFFDNSLLGDKNILPQVTHASTSKILVISASEMFFLIQYFGILIGSRVPETYLQSYEKGSRVFVVYDETLGQQQWSSAQISCLVSQIDDRGFQRQCNIGLATNRLGAVV
uniref:Uncharacterized protein n=1 Tax=Trichogramma kaykai TaxID=54128 RepID=A0ABD2XN08_9HYME